jgi:arylsulfatase
MRTVNPANYWQRWVGLAAHLKSREEYPPSLGSDTLSMKKAVDAAMNKLENPHGSCN